jgi:hypothetical protein
MTIALQSTDIIGRLIDGRYHYSIRSSLPLRPDEKVLFRIQGGGDHPPRSAPNPASPAELDEWISNLRQAGCTIIDGNY